MSVSVLYLSLYLGNTPSLLHHSCTHPSNEMGVFLRENEKRKENCRLSSADLRLLSPSCSDRAEPPRGNDRPLDYGHRIHRSEMKGKERRGSLQRKRARRVLRSAGCTFCHQGTYPVRAGLFPNSCSGSPSLHRVGKRTWKSATFPKIGVEETSLFINNQGTSGKIPVCSCFFAPSCYNFLEKVKKKEVFP